jgi:hypothetical protein
MTSRFLTRTLSDDMRCSAPRCLLTAMMAVGLAWVSAGVANATPEDDYATCIKDMGPGTSNVVVCCVQVGGTPVFSTIHPTQYTYCQLPPAAGQQP